MVVAGMVLEALDQSVDPCEDFYKFSCGKWEQKTVIPESKSSYGRFNEVDDMIKMQLKGKSMRSLPSLTITCLHSSRVVITCHH